MVRGVMHRCMAHFVVHNDGFAVHGRGTLVRLTGLHAGLQLGELLMLLCSNGHQLRSCGFSGSFQMLQRLSSRAASFFFSFMSAARVRRTKTSYSASTFCIRRSCASRAVGAAWACCNNPGRLVGKVATDGIGIALQLFFPALGFPMVNLNLTHTMPYLLQSRTQRVTDCGGRRFRLC